MTCFAVCAAMRPNSTDATGISWRRRAEDSVLACASASQLRIGSALPLQTLVNDLHTRNVEYSPVSRSIETKIRKFPGSAFGRHRERVFERVDDHFGTPFSNETDSTTNNISFDIPDLFKPRHNPCPLYVAERNQKFRIFHLHDDLVVFQTGQRTNDVAALERIVQRASTVSPMLSAYCSSLNSTRSIPGDDTSSV
jgi:hypothetical protein